MLLSRYHRLNELIRSEIALREGIENSPPLGVLPNLQLLAEGLDEVVDLLGHPIEISSGYRCAALNARVGGAKASQHVQGQAADFTCDAFGTPLQVAAVIVASPIAFDQCILEFGRWIHLSFTRTPRRRALTIYATDQGYLAGLRRPDGTLLADAAAPGTLP